MEIAGLKREQDAVKLIAMRKGPHRARGQQVNRSRGSQRFKEFALIAPVLLERSSCMEREKNSRQLPQLGLLRWHGMFFQEHSFPGDMRARQQRRFWHERHGVTTLQCFNSTSAQAKPSDSLDVSGYMLVARQTETQKSF
jgi:hypothetical protein